MKRLRGFTLIELMIVLVVVAILAAIAIPAWQRYAYRSRRPDGQELLIRIAQAEERFYTTSNHYAAALSSIGYPADTTTSEHKYYVASVAPVAGSSTGTTFIATAQPQGAQQKDVCGNLTIDNTGSKQPDSSSGNAAYNTNGPCWGQ